MAAGTHPAVAVSILAEEIEPETMTPAVRFSFELTHRSSCCIIIAVQGGLRCIVSIRFEWDPSKASENLRKHRVTFEEAATVFGDHLSMTAPDPDHSTEEDRFITVGSSSRNRLLMIAHTERGDSIRIISARELTPRERRQYEKGNWNER